MGGHGCDEGVRNAPVGILAMRRASSTALVPVGTGEYDA